MGLIRMGFPFLGFLGPPFGIDFQARVIAVYRSNINPLGTAMIC